MYKSVAFVSVRNTCVKVSVRPQLSFSQNGRTSLYWYGIIKYNITNSLISNPIMAFPFATLRVRLYVYTPAGLSHRPVFTSILNADFAHLSLG
jgi:hypothetical protein